MKRQAYLALGHLALGLGLVGLFLPIMPTVVFLIAAAACYARSSPRLRARLLEHPKLGPPIRDWEEHRAISIRAKVTGIVMVTVGLVSSSLLVVEKTWMRIALWTINLGVVVLLLLLKTRK
jgi:uncharacterized membrane protein YbaN (DUF454 family)